VVSRKQLPVWCLHPAFTGIAAAGQVLRDHPSILAV
jgi:hypothetical protein